MLKHDLAAVGVADGLDSGIPMRVDGRTDSLYFRVDVHLRLAELEVEARCEGRLWRHFLEEDGGASSLRLQLP